MNREIKFRAQRLDNKEWIYGDFINNSKIYPFNYIGIGIGYKIDNPEIGKAIKVYPSTVGQFTGQKDCNGREIYEGDIVEILTISDRKRIVEFIKGSFRMTHGDISWYLADHNTKEEIEVKGNIYDNPELLVNKI